MVICLKRCADLHSALSCIRTIKWLIIITIIVITDVDNWPAVAAAEMQPAVHSPATLVLTPRLAPSAADDQLQTCTWPALTLTHSWYSAATSLQQSISIRDLNWFGSLCESIRFVKTAFRFTSCHAVFLAYLLYSLSQKISWRHCLRRLILQNIDKNSYAMHTTKITPTHYLNISVQATNFSDCWIESNPKKIDSVARIESNLNFFAGIGMLYTAVPLRLTVSGIRPAPVGVLIMLDVLAAVVQSIQL